MENQQGGSFIPKSPVRGTVKPSGVRKVYIFTYVAFVFFFGTLLATAGTFFYNISIESQLAAQKERLAQARNSFNQADLERVRELESRMDSAFGILNKKVSILTLLEALQDTTLRSVQIKGFEYIKNIDNSLNLKLAIETTDFNAALFQREVLSGSPVLKGATISDITHTNIDSVSEGESLSKSTVSFTVSKKLSIDEIPYMVKNVTTAPLQTETIESATSTLQEDIPQDQNVAADVTNVEGTGQ